MCTGRLWLTKEGTPSVSIFEDTPHKQIVNQTAAEFGPQWLWGKSNAFPRKVRRWRIRRKARLDAWKISLDCCGCTSEFLSGFTYWFGGYSGRCAGNNVSFKSHSGHPLDIQIVVLIEAWVHHKYLLLKIEKNNNFKQFKKTYKAVKWSNQDRSRNATRNWQGN